MRRGDEMLGMSLDHDHDGRGLPGRIRMKSPDQMKITTSHHERYARLIGVSRDAIGAVDMA